MRELLERKPISIDGVEFILSKFPASDGRDIICQYVPSGVPVKMVGDYAINRKMADRILSYVAVSLPEGNEVRLTTVELIDSHCVSWERRIKLEFAMMEYNWDAFREGRISSFFGDFAQNITTWISSMLTASLGQLSQKTKPPSKS